MRMRGSTATSLQIDLLHWPNLMLLSALVELLRQVRAFWLTCQPPATPKQLSPAILQPADGGSGG